MRSINFALSLFAITFYSSIAFCSPPNNSGAPDKNSLIERGRYLTIIAGCNDCHTPGFPETGGNVPEKEWLTGVPIGWFGPWGTTYAINIRSLLSAMNEEQWITFAKGRKSRPPMPSYILQTMTDEDLKAIFAFVTKLGPAGAPMPAAQPPGEKPKTAYFNFTPQEPKP